MEREKVETKNLKESKTKKRAHFLFLVVFFFLVLVWCSFSVCSGEVKGNEVEVKDGAKRSMEPFWWPW